MRKTWLIKTPNPQLQVVLSDQLGVHPIVAQLLANRGIKNKAQAKEFLSAAFRDLHDPFLLQGMRQAVERIHQAKERAERVLIFGDYDVDGVTSCAILFNALKKFGLEVITHIPHRISDGYGLNREIASYAQQNSVRLLISVDCGVSAIEEVAYLTAQGIDVIVIDHHEPLKEHLPSAVAVIDPKRHDCDYPFRDLSAAALAFKCAQALFGQGHHDDLDLAALGTIADVVPLYGENRILVKEGLPRIAQTKNVGLKALMQSARITSKKLNPRHVGFILGPRLNAMGRIDSAERSLELLLTKDLPQAQRIAQTMEEYNKERQKTQGAIIDQALAMVEGEVNFQKERVIVLGQEGWHRGVVGIVAARIADTFYRPAVILSFEDGLAIGSARSIEGFHLFEALSHCSSLLENFGGHQYAAGLTLKRENIETFKQRINEIAFEWMSQEDLTPSLRIDCEIPLSGVTMDLVKIIQQLEPYGEANPEPLFCTRGLIVKSPPAILGRGTIKFWVTDGQRVFSAVGFGMEAYRPIAQVGRSIDVAYKVSIDDWNKPATVQLELKDMKES